MVIPGSDRGHGEQDMIQAVSVGLGCADGGSGSSVGSATISSKPTGVAADAPIVSKLAVVNGQPPTPHPCGPSIKCPKGKENAEVMAGGEPAEDHGLGTASSFIKKEFLYEEDYRDPKRDTFPDAEMERKPSAPDGQHCENSGDSTLSAGILAYAEGRSQGFTLSHLWESGHFRDTKRDTLKKALQRMPGKKLSKIGAGKRALFCKPEYEEAVRANCQAAQVAPAAPGKAANCTVTNPRLPRVEDLLMKKPQVPPQPLSLTWALGLERLIRVSTGNVVIIGGSTDAGKTILLLDFIMRNMDGHSIRCINWEMDEGELYDRLRLLEKYYDIPVDSFYDKVEFVDWYCDALDPKSMEGLIHLIDPDKVNIVDYLTANRIFTGSAASWSGSTTSSERVPLWWPCRRTEEPNYPTARVTPRRSPGWPSPWTRPRTRVQIAPTCALPKPRGASIATSNPPGWTSSSTSWMEPSWSSRRPGIRARVTNP